MFIGSLFEKKSGVAPRVSYTRMGAPIAISNPAAWNDVLLSGMDITVELGEVCFADRVFVTLGEGSCAARADVLYWDGEWRLGGTVSGPLSGEISLSLGMETSALLVRLYGCIEDLSVEKLDVTGGVFSGVCVYPLPKQMESLPGVNIPLSELILAGDESEDAGFARAYFAELCPVGNGEYPVRFVTDPALAEEEYTIVSEADYCTVSASSRRGFVFAAATLAQLCADGALPRVKIHDAPMCEMRGFHMGIPARNKFPFAKRLIKHLLVPMKYNTIFFEIAGAMRYDRHPEINEMWNTIQEKMNAGEWPNFPHHIVMCGNGDTLEKAEVRELVDFAESFGIEVIPEVQSLSHVQYLTKAHPEIAEIAEDKPKVEEVKDLRLADIPTNDFYPDSYCPSNEKSYELLFDILDEVIEVFRPKRFVHMGHDELYTHNVCPICKHKTVAEIFASDVNRIHAHLKKHGLRMVIWGDMLNTVNAYAAPDAIDNIPKDILLLDFIWYFAMESDTEKRLLDHGFEVAVGNLYASHFPRFESRIRRPGMMGGQVSTWVETDEKVLSYEGKLYDVMFTANMLWSEEYDSRAYDTYAKYLMRLIPSTRSRVLYENGAPSQNGKFTALSVPQTAGVPYEVRVSLPQGKQTLLGVEYDVSCAAVSAQGDYVAAPESVTVPANCQAESFIFLLAAATPAKRIAWAEMIEVASLTVSYTDGSEEIVPLEYGYNVYDIHARYGAPLEGGYYRHEGFSGTFAIDGAYNGKSADGRDLSLRAFEWQNPHAEKTVASVTLRAAEDAPCATCLFAVTAVQKKA